MRTEGFQAYDGRSALRLACEFLPEIIFLDLVMPDVSGVMLARRLREIEGLQGSRFIALTALTQASVRAATLAAGFHGYIEKPASAGDMINALVEHGPSSGAGAKPATPH